MAFVGSQEINAFVNTVLCDTLIVPDKQTAPPPPPTPNPHPPALAAWQSEEDLTKQREWSGRTVLHLVVVTALFCCVLQTWCHRPDCSSKESSHGHKTQHVVPGRLPTEVSRRTPRPRRQWIRTWWIVSLRAGHEPNTRATSTDIKYTVGLGKALFS